MKVVKIKKATLELNADEVENLVYVMKNLDKDLSKAHEIAELAEEITDELEKW